MLCNFVAELRGVSKGNEFKRKDGTIGFNCNVLIEQDCRAYTFAADEQVFKDFENQLIKKGDECAFVAEYNPQFYNPKFPFQMFKVKEAAAL